MSLLEQPTGQLKTYKPEELDEGLQKALKAIDEDIRKQESELKKLKDNRKILKSDKKYMRENINSRINELKKEKQNLLFESKERSDWEFKTASFDPDNPATSDEIRRRGGREKRLMRQQLAKERAKAKIAAGEVTAETPEGIKSSEVKTANIVVANQEWGKLSNLSPNSFEYDGRQYRSVEHAYQTLKSGEFHEPTYRAYLDKPQAMKIASGPPADKATNIQLMEDLYKQMLSENPETLELLNKTEGMKITHILGSGKEGIWGKEMPRILNKLKDEFKSTVTDEFPLKKIISGLQKNVDQYGIEAAKELGLEYGGTVNKGFKVVPEGSNSPNFEEFKTSGNWEEIESQWYPDRTKANAQNSDGTVWFGEGDSRGYGATKREVGNKPWIENPSSEELRKFIIDNNIQTLNVAGNRSYGTEELGENAKQTIIDSVKNGTPEVKTDYTKVKGPDLKDLPGTLSFIDDTPPELKADLGLMYKMPPPLVDGVAKVGAKVWNQALKVLPIIDEEILIQAPSKILQYGLKGLGLGTAAGTIGTATGAIGTYELYWMFINLGKAALNQAMGEAAEPGGVPPMLFSEHIELGENSEFSNAEQFMKDYEAWAKGSVAIQAFRGITGHDDPIEWGMSGFKKGERGVNFYGYNMVKGLFGGNK